MLSAVRSTVRGTEHAGSIGTVVVIGIVPRRKPSSKEDQTRTQMPVWHMSPVPFPVVRFGAHSTVTQSITVLRT